MALRYRLVPREGVTYQVCLPGSRPCRFTTLDCFAWLEYDLEAENDGAHHETGKYRQHERSSSETYQPCCEPGPETD